LKLGAYCIFIEIQLRRGQNEGLETGIPQRVAAAETQWGSRDKVPKSWKPIHRTAGKQLVQTSYFVRAGRVFGVIKVGQ